MWRDFLSEYYLWIKVFHLFFMVAWMAGLFYLPRLFVYHTRANKGGELSETLKVMECKLLKIIMNPAMILTFFFGVLLLLTPGVLSPLTAISLHLKIFFVLCLAGFHGYLAHCRKLFVQDKNPHSEKFFRILNEIPSFLLLIIVVLVVVKPF